MKEITNETNDNINRTEEATESPKANTETTEEMDEGENAGADKKTENNQSNGIVEEADDENKNKNQNKNKNKDNQEDHLNKRTEKIISTEDNKEVSRNQDYFNMRINSMQTEQRQHGVVRRRKS